MDYCYCDVIEKIYDYEILIILEVVNNRKNPARYSPEVIAQIKGVFKEE